MTTTMTTAVPHCTSRRDFVAQCRKDNVEFLEANRRKVYIEYVRDERGNPTAIMVAVRNGEKPEDFNFGFSAATFPDRFDKVIGLWKAIRRASRLSKKTPTPPFRLTENLISFYDNAEYEFGRKMSKDV